MGELARRRGARELWISRGHLWAAGAGGLFAVVIAFTGGYTLGRSQSSAPSDPGPQFLGADAADEDLVQLLARVEASSDPTGGLGRLSFPEALAGEETEVVSLDAVDQVRGQGEVEAGLHALGGSGEVPPGSWSLDLGMLSSSRRERITRELEGHGEVYAVEEIVDGERSRRTWVGAWSSKREAEHGRRALAEATGLPELDDAEVTRVP